MYNEMSYVYRIRAVKDWHFIIDEYNEGIRNAYFIERSRYNKTGWDMVHQCSSLEHAFERMKSILDDYDNQKQFYEGASIFDTEKFKNKQPVVVNNNDAVASTGCCSGTKVSCVNLTFGEALECLKKGMVVARYSWREKFGFLSLHKGNLFFTFPEVRLETGELLKRELTTEWVHSNRVLLRNDWAACDTIEGLKDVLSVDES